MAGESVARRYARAIFELAIEHGQPLESWLTDLQMVEQILQDSAIRSALVAPNLSFERKRELVGRVVPDLEPLRRNFLYLLVERGRVELIGAVVREFRQMMLEHQGIAEATVTTAVPISEVEAAHVGDELSRLIGKKVIVQWQVDPSIIGGIVARVGDRLINGSVAGRLAALRQQLV